MKCEKCGVENIENAYYCQECGNKIEEFSIKTPVTNKIPYNYKKILYIGYFSVTLILISAFLKLIVNSMYGTLNGIWSLIIRIILIMGIIIFIYFLFQVYKIKNDITNDPSSKYHKLFILIALAGLLLISQNIIS